MKTRVLSLLALPLAALSCESDPRYEPRDGDIVFHTSRSEQSLAIQRATGSPYSHMGIVYIRDGEPYVFEAAATVRLTPLRQWVERGVGGRFVAKRLAAADELLTEAAVRRMVAEGSALQGRPYDPYFEWSDDRIYCSELVWKVLRRGLGIEVGELQTLSNFHTEDPLVSAKLAERFGGAPPTDEPVIAPSAMFASDLLVLVFER